MNKLNSQLTAKSAEKIWFRAMPCSNWVNLNLKVKIVNL
jgi:hypothetical protein